MMTFTAPPPQPWVARAARGRSWRAMACGAIWLATAPGWGVSLGAAGSSVALPGVGWPPPAPPPVQSQRTAGRRDTASCSQVLSDGPTSLHETGMSTCTHPVGSGGQWSDSNAVAYTSCDAPARAKLDQDFTIRDSVRSVNDWAILRSHQRYAISEFCGSGREWSHKAGNT